MKKSVFKILSMILSAFILTGNILSLTDSGIIYSSSRLFNNMTTEKIEKKPDVLQTSNLKSDFALAENAKSAVLMDASTGKILFEKNSHERLEPASVTKIMTLLLVAEAVDAGKITLKTMVTTSEHAKSMGGSQIFLEVGEQMSVDDLLKAAFVSSANDACVALAEHLCGSEQEFVSNMNRRAKELSMNDTSFENCTGLPDETNLTSANDIAVMSRELLKHSFILQYTNIWMDTLRDGKFGLSNTNKLIRFYKGANGLKTGFTDKAKFCLSGTALRNGLQLISVVMGCNTSNERFNEVKEMLDYGFANYDFYDLNKFDKEYKSKIKFAKESEISGKIDFTSGKGFIVKKGGAADLKSNIELKNNLCAPVRKGEVIGNLIVKQNDKEIGKYKIKANKNIDKLTFKDYFLNCIKKIVFIKKD